MDCETQVNMAAFGRRSMSEPPSTDPATSRGIVHWTNMRHAAAPRPSTRRALGTSLVVTVLAFVAVLLVPQSLRIDDAVSDDFLRAKNCEHGVACPRAGPPTTQHDARHHRLWLLILATLFKAGGDVEHVSLIINLAIALSVGLFALMAAHFFPGAALKIPCAMFLVVSLYVTGYPVLWPPGMLSLALVGFAFAVMVLLRRGTLPAIVFASLMQAFLIEVHVYYYIVIPLLMFCIGLSCKNYLRGVGCAWFCLLLVTGLLSRDAIAVNFFPQGSFGLRPGLLFSAVLLATAVGVVVARRLPRGTVARFAPELTILGSLIWLLPTLSYVAVSMDTSFHVARYLGLGQMGYAMLLVYLFPALDSGAIQRRLACSPRKVRLLVVFGSVVAVLVGLGALNLLITGVYLAAVLGAGSARRLALAPRPRALATFCAGAAPFMVIAVLVVVARLESDPRYPSTYPDARTLARHFVAAGVDFEALRVRLRGPVPEKDSSLLAAIGIYMPLKSGEAVNGSGQDVMVMAPDTATAARDFDRLVRLVLPTHGPVLIGYQASLIDYSDIESCVDYRPDPGAGIEIHCQRGNLYTAFRRNRYFLRRTFPTRSLLIQMEEGSWRDLRHVERWRHSVALKAPADGLTRTICVAPEAVGKWEILAVEGPAARIEAGRSCVTLEAGVQIEGRLLLAARGDAVKAERYFPFVGIQGPAEGAPLHHMASAATFQVHPWASHSSLVKQCAQLSSHSPGHSSRKQEMSCKSQSVVHSETSGCQVPPAAKHASHSPPSLESGGAAESSQAAPQDRVSPSDKMSTTR